ncbi:MAG TPA: hypothetical protein VD837_15970, partial [Terriglobales bacterium]|nr:hypothetical protein [Terriglobales bacterium]
MRRGSSSLSRRIIAKPFRNIGTAQTADKGTHKALVITRALCFYAVMLREAGVQQQELELVTIESLV